MSAVVDTGTIADAYIEYKLEPDETIQAEAPSGIWPEAAEQGTRGRFIKYVYQQTRTAGNDTFQGMQIINNRIIYEIHTYIIAMVGENERFLDLATGATQIKKLLHNAKSGDDFTSARVWSEYKGLHKELVPDGDQKYPELGGVYEITVQPLGV